MADKRSRWPYTCPVCDDTRYGRWAEPDSERRCPTCGSTALVLCFVIAAGDKHGCDARNVPLPVDKYE
jgi:ssDNA-binding Zn-finger/Zn-ribbon topoisomerase 1